MTQENIPDPQPVAKSSVVSGVGSETPPVGRRRYSVFSHMLCFVQPFWGLD